MDNFRLRSLPVSVRLAITFFLMALGFGYLLALLNLYIHLSKADGVNGLTSADIVRTFHGPENKQTMLEAKVTFGSMKDFVPDDLSRGKLVSWARDGAPEKQYNEEIAKIFNENCIGCHNPDGLMKNFPLTSYKEITNPAKRLISQDRGKSIASLVQSSHTHFISMGMMFFLLALLFFCTGAPSWLKNLILPIPFIGIICDVGGWWLTKYIAGFAHLVMAGGAMMGTAFAVFSFGIFGECWFARKTATAAQLSSEYQRSRTS